MKSPGGKTAKTKNAIDCGDGFYKSSFSSGGDCVAVNMAANSTVKVRDTKDAAKQTLVFTRNEWSAFLKGVEHGEFDI